MNVVRALRATVAHRRDGEPRSQQQIRRGPLMAALALAAAAAAASTGVGLLLHPWSAVSSNTALVTLDFVSTEDGWATTTAISGAAVPVLLQTTDGGVTWTAVTPEVAGSPATS